MARVFKTKPTGRPKKEINWELFEEMCHIQCTQSEICSCLKVDPDTLKKHSEEKYAQPYSEIYKKYSEGGKKSLRRYQFDLAKTNTAMAIWLGKQWLGQKEPENEKQFTPPNDATIENTLNVLHENKRLKEELNALKSKANSELPRSEQAV